MSGPKVEDIPLLFLILLFGLLFNARLRKMGDYSNSFSCIFTPCNLFYALCLNYLIMHLRNIIICFANCSQCAVQQLMLYLMHNSLVLIAY